jgi:hypothetical protein
MKISLSAASHRWRGAFVAAGLAAVAAACGSDEPTNAPIVSNGGNAGSGDGDAGTPPPGGSAGVSGLGGAGSMPSGAGGESFGGDGGAPVVPGGPCTAGATQACSFDLLCTGVQTCGDDGSFGTCVCDTSALLGGGIIGARCEADGDCAGGATCLRADSNIYLGAGGPAGGYCSFPCSVLSQDPYDDDCDTHDLQSFCAPLGPDGATYCLRTCFSLDPDPGEAKCLNRPELVCISRAAGGSEPFNGMRQEGYCAPQCGSDADCPDGRVCHAQAGICTDAQVAGAPIGARCTLDTECSGLACEDLDPQNVGVCTAACTLGSLSGCGYARDASSRGAACITPQVAAGRFSEGVGDLGFCRELCDVAEDCERADEGWVCSPINEGAATFFGRPGACVPPG